MKFTKKQLERFASPISQSESIFAMERNAPMKSWKR